MKKIILFISLLLFPFLVSASSDVINNFDMDIYIDQSGDAYIREEWDATANMGSEFYHTYNNYGNSTFSDFTVTMDDKAYTFVDDWDINASIEDKAYKNGFNYTNEGIEICFGKSSLGTHKYIVQYKISNFVLETKDSQIVYWTLLPYNNGGQFKNIHIKMYSDFTYEDTLEVWGYGNYGGTSYVYDGYIEMNSDGAISNDEYMTILVKFPLGSFNTSNIDDSTNFDYYYNLAEEGSTHYVDDSNNINIFAIIMQIVIWVLVVTTIVKVSKNSANTFGKYRLDFGKRGKKLNKDIPNYRDIPCNKNIYRAYFISSAFSISKNKTDLLGAVLLKWLKEDKISTKKVTSKILKRESLVIDLKQSTFDSSIESKLYGMLKEAAKDNLLEQNEFEKWCSSNYKEILKWFDEVFNNTGDYLINDASLTETKKKLGINTCTVNDKMYDEGEKLYGLKQYLIEFSRIQEKEPIEVKLWEEYLIYAQIFGIAKEVAKQFKKLYPEILTDKSYNYDFDTVIFLNTFSTSSVSAATTARSRAESYSSGGGGFSSGGGGGGSFGGGGGGGAGGR